MTPLVSATTDARILGVTRFTAGLALVLVPLGVLMAALYAPLLPGFDEGGPHASPLGQKIFYFHVPFAFAAYAALTVLVAASYRALSREDMAADALAAASGEVGVLFAALTLFTGSLWSHLEWGVYWRNSDLKLLLTLVLFLVYVAYLVLRRQVDDPRRRARIAAVYGIIGFVLVPLSYAAGRVWQTVHPIVLGGGPPDSGIVTPGVHETLVVNAAAILVLAGLLVLLRWRLELRRRAAEADG